MRVGGPWFGVVELILLGLAVGVEGIAVRVYEVDCVFEFYVVVSGEGWCLGMEGRFVPHCFMAVSPHFFIESPCVEAMVIYMMWSVVVVVVMWRRSGVELGQS